MSTHEQASGDSEHQARLRLHAEEHWEAPPFEGPSLEPRLLELVARLTPEGGTVIDLGCGTGHLLVEIHRALAPARVRCVGIDASPAMIELAASTHRDAAAAVEWRVGDAYALELAPASVDVLVSRCADFDPAEVARVLRPGGCFVEWGLGPRDSEDLALAFGPRFACEYAPHDVEGWYAAREAALREHGLLTLSLELAIGDDFLDREQLEDSIEMVPLVEPFSRTLDAAVLDGLRRGPRPGGDALLYRIRREHTLRVARRREPEAP